MKLLSRKEFREECFKRDGYKCVLCGVKASYDQNNEVNNLDAHHIYERRLWDDGGFYLCNAATLCDPTCHMKAEQTLVSPEQLREKCGIKKFILPQSFSEGEVIDKWGNPILPNGTRMKGELFEGHETILAPVIHLFVDKVKFPRTYHLPWSEGRSSDDKVLESLDSFIGQEVVVTTKYDGENTTMTRNDVYARSTSTPNHPSRTVVRSLHGSIKHDIPEGIRICGENLYAKHSIHYKDLDSYYLVFNVWNNKNVALSWDETKEWAELLGLKTVKEVYRGPWDEKVVKEKTKHLVEQGQEGYVVRVTTEIPYAHYRTKVGKMVRKNHVQTNDHWLNQELVPNKLLKQE